MTTPTPQAVKLADYRPSPYSIDTVDLQISLDPVRHAGAQPARHPPQSLPAPRPAPAGPRRREHRAVRHPLDGTPLAADSYVISPNLLTIAAAARALHARDRDRLRPEANTALSGLYRVERHLLHPVRGRRLPPHHLFPRPARRAGASTRARIEADDSDAPVLLSNGNPVASGDARRTAAISPSGTTPSPSPPISSRWSAAISALVARQLHHHVGPQGRRSRIYVEHGKEDRCAYAMDALKRSMRWDEEAFGREYDLDVFNIVAVSDFNMGAMENKGLNIFNDKYVLASPETATDADYAAHRGVIAHEYFHNWTGNRITCRDWFQLCLKEGLTVFRDQEFSADMRSRAGEAHRRRARRCAPRQFPEDAGPLAHPVRPDSYHRDQQLLHGDRLREGRRGLPHAADAARRRRPSARAWTSISSATTARPRRSRISSPASRTPSGRDLSQFMRWYTQAGTPQVTAEARHDPHTAASTSRLNSSAPADTRPADKHAPAHPARHRPCRPGRRGLAARSRRHWRPQCAVDRADRTEARCSASATCRGNPWCPSIAASRHR